MGPGGVPVYSSDYASADRAELPTRQAYRSYVDGIYMGHKWQCVELARRWMYLNRGYVFDDIAMAYDIFRLRHVRMVADGTLLPLRAFRNGAKRPPEPGALLIWNEGGEFDVTGHVAVVTEVLPDRVRCIEQNVDDRAWADGRSWSRELPAATDEHGGFRVSCTFDDTAILGWVIQTGDDTHAEAIADPDPRLFTLQLGTVPEEGQADRPWLDGTDENQAAYIEMMGGCRLTDAEADQYKYFCISETALREVRRATNELHRMFLHATNYVLEDVDRLRRFNIPPALWPRIQQSWNNRRSQMITGRFDFSVSERGVKVYEYNCDSASCHMECGFVQGRWASHFGCDTGRSAGEGLHEALVEAWRESGVDDVLHIMQDRDLEETYHALYMKAAIEKAGIRCKIVRGTAGLQWGEGGRVCDADGVSIRWVWKTWAWETALDQIRDDLADDEENLRLHRTIDRDTQRPRLVDVLLRKEVMVFEPLWALIPSNKAILPVLYAMYPNSRYLLNSQYELTDELRRTGYVSKPIVGRCGANISIYNRHEDLITETPGQFDSQDQVYQELFRLPQIGDNNVQIGTFSVGGAFGGACVRVDPSLVITTSSGLWPLRVVPDAEFLAG
ncbi:MAG: bifunctional glutathionylspermidine amidase/synthase [Alphaproteobacteria bacterium]|nr:bifunctional glutathionylspermidine amidase/synthase [Alphaproteobacteria bacterium]